MASIFILGIIIGKLGYQQESSLIILLTIDKNLKICIYYIILLFDLAVSLKVKYDKKVVFKAKKIIEQQPKFQGKN